MAKLVKTRVEREGSVYDRSSVVEGPAPPAWPSSDALHAAGKSQPRIDGLERVTGRAVYTHDIRMPGMLYARVLRSPFPHARIKRISLRAAEALPGVRAVLSSQNVPGFIRESNPWLLGPVLRYAGEEVAAVAADTCDIAEDALRLIEVEYQELPFVLEIEEALQPDAPLVHGDSNRVHGRPQIYERGNIRRGFARADMVVEETFRTQSALHNCLETHGAVARWDGDELTVWESTQSIYHVQDDLAEAFNLPRNNIRVICRYMGGGFGSKQSSGNWSLLAALLARQTGRPVRLILDRREENLASGNRAPTIQRLKIGARSDGTLTAIELIAATAIGAYGGGPQRIEGPAQVMYECPNVRTEVSAVFTNTGPARAFRGPGYVEGAFPLESLIDELAFKLNLDPLDVRLKNYARSEQTFNRPYSAKHLDRCYRQGAELIGWQSGRSQSRGRLLRGKGMASQTWGGGGGPPAYAWVRINSDGSVEVITGSQDIGTGTRTVFAQIAAEELGIDPGRIAVHVGDTARGPYCPVSWGSMTVSSVGPAVRQAAVDARRQLEDIAAGLLDLPSGRVEIRGGNIFLKGETSPRAAIGEITGEIGDLTILGKGSREPNPAEVDLRTFGAQFVEVEVNAGTGEVKVERVVTVHDFGRVINPLGSRSQVEGAVIQGIGYALTEGRTIDEKTGLVLNDNLEEYLVPSMLDFGEIGYGFIDRPDNRANSLGAKGLGEPALIPTAPAIANAIASATGVRFLSLPITRDKVLSGIKSFPEGRGVVP